MERPEFNITITQAGKVKVEIKGVKGKRCIDMADLIKELVGREEQRKLTADYYEMEGQVRINTHVSDQSH